MYEEEGTASAAPREGELISASFFVMEYFSVKAQEIQGSALSSRGTYISVAVETRLCLHFLPSSEA